MVRTPRPKQSLLVVMAVVGALIATGPTTASAATGVPEPLPAIPLSDDMISPLELAELTGAPLASERKARPGAPVADYLQANHTIDVAVVAPSGSAGSTTFIDDAGVRNLVARTGAYWTAQSDGQVLSLTANASIKRYASTFTCSDYSKVWEEAAGKFGPTGVSAYVTTQSRHLLVLVPAACGGRGLGTVGVGGQGTPGVANGGAIWVSMAGLNDVDVLAHEFGHNLGLQHSNTHTCPDVTMSEGLLVSATAFSDGCADQPYGDAYDVMGAARSMKYNGTLYTNANPTALNVAHKERLGVVVGGEVQAVSLPAGSATAQTSATLASTGAASGLRALKITDPLTGRIYYVDFRGGGGTDAGSLYETGYLRSYGTAMGVRVMTRRADGSSVVLLSPDAGTGDGHKLYLAAGQRLSTRSGGVTVSVRGISSGAADVTVTLATAPPVAPVSRLSGADRFATSAAISAANFSPGAPVVYVANGLSFPDALSGAPVAGKNGAPVLLISATSVPAAIKTELVRLKPGRIVILGGAGAVGAAVETALKSYTGGTVTRLLGADRFATSAAISAANFTPGVPLVYVANGTSFPDALSGAPVAGKNAAPVLIVSATTIPSAIRTELGRLKPGRIVILGGTGAVSAAVETALKSYSAGSVSRVMGADRFATSAAISAANFSAGAPVVYVANGTSFPDALSGAPVAGTNGAPVLLVGATGIPAATQAELTRLRPAHIVILGGAGAVSSGVAAQLATFVP